jgi:hypothetical protein
MGNLQKLDRQDILGMNIIAYGTQSKPLFPAKVIADWLGIASIAQMLTSVDDDEKVLRSLNGKTEQWLKYDAERLMAVISKRFEKYGLSVHPDKTKLVVFMAPNRYDRRRNDKGNDDGKPESFDLLGFTHYWGKTKSGNWAVQRKTMKSRIARSIQKIERWCRDNRHKPIVEQWKELCAKVRGHYGYYGITGNFRSLGKFLNQVHRSWRRWLNQRNSKRGFLWEKFNVFLARYPLPTPKIVHSVFKVK